MQFCSELHKTMERFMISWNCREPDRLNLRTKGHVFESPQYHREILKSSIQKSRNIAIAVDQTGSRLNQASHNLAYLQAPIKNMATKCAVYEIGGHVDRAITPATSVLKVLDLVYELQDSLQIDPRAPALFTHLATIKRLQGALKLLADNCRLVILWLEDVVQILKDNAAADDDWYLIRVSNVVNILVKLQLFCQDGGWSFVLCIRQTGD
ncbi:hypothetical protein C2S53_009726 [Perilla frutescens var. hirtella]|uniref:Uncharacterized protein n=1 Tax=Perilla frutescens var. hirtella TaxID=608512 RepID=A0AAD4ITV6_PERFH|nr:hypothetical protein C2S53_009726 [Perilla frutescens var. hirtella]